MSITTNPDPSRPILDCSCTRSPRIKHCSCSGVKVGRTNGKGSGAKGAVVSASFSSASTPPGYASSPDTTSEEEEEVRADRSRSVGTGPPLRLLSSVVKRPSSRGGAKSKSAVLRSNPPIDAVSATTVAALLESPLVQRLRRPVVRFLALRKTDLTFFRKPNGDCKPPEELFRPSSSSLSSLSSSSEEAALLNGADGEDASDDDEKDCCRSFLAIAQSSVVVVVVLRDDEEEVTVPWVMVVLARWTANPWVNHPPLVAHSDVVSEDTNNHKTPTSTAQHRCCANDRRLRRGRILLRRPAERSRASDIIMICRKWWHCWSIFRRLVLRPRWLVVTKRKRRAWLGPHTKGGGCCSYSSSSMTVPIRKLSSHQPSLPAMLSSE